MGILRENKESPKQADAQKGFVQAKVLGFIDPRLGGGRLGVTGSLGVKWTTPTLGDVEELFWLLSARRSGYLQLRPLLGGKVPCQNCHR